MFIQKVKKGAVLFGCLCMAMVPVTPMAVKADEMEQIQPYSESISRHTLVFDISNTGKARISANVVGKAGTSKKVWWRLDRYKDLANIKERHV